jgi:hypothetical protein
MVLANSTLDLSQKAEKGMLYICQLYICLTRGAASMLQMPSLSVRLTLSARPLLLGLLETVLMRMTPRLQKEPAESAPLNPPPFVTKNSAFLYLDALELSLLICSSLIKDSLLIKTSPKCCISNKPFYGTAMQPQAP